MRLVNIGIILSIAIAITFGQSPYEIDPMVDVYGFEVVFLKEILTDKCDCCCSVSKKCKECTLYEVGIKSIFLQRDSFVYKDDTSLSKVKYVVIPSQFTNNNILLDSTYTVLAYSSCSDQILVINQLLKAQTSVTSEYKGLAFFSGITGCKKFTLLQKFFLNLGLNKDKIYRKARDMSPNESKFVQSIGKD